MSAKILAEHCAATLAGIKTGNLFRVSISGPNMLRKELRKWNRILNGKGLRLIPVRYGDDFALLYLYRQEHLMRDLRDPMALDILRSLGYRTGKYSSMVAQLVGRMRKEGFPHEVGLFLGYPPADVMGFLRDPHSGVKCVGCWKVYGDAEQAEKKFAAFRQCKELYCRHLENGWPLENLIVGSRAANQAMAG